ncbi:hypothetical protein DFQ26_008081 [Actinomortierella ambigua]|nr:hypothetical protein DFQ26_008081 [Actinomortierella ambigua]
MSSVEFPFMTHEGLITVSVSLSQFRTLKRVIDEIWSQFKSQAPNLAKGTAIIAILAARALLSVGAPFAATPANLATLFSCGGLLISIMRTLYGIDLTKYLNVIVDGARVALQQDSVRREIERIVAEAAARILAVLANAHPVADGPLQTIALPPPVHALPPPDHTPPSPPPPPPPTPVHERLGFFFAFFKIRRR